MASYFHSKSITIGFIAAPLIFIILGTIVFFANRRFSEMSYMVAHTNEVLHHSEQLLATIIDLETGQRGYVITGDTAFLEPYRKAAKTIERHFDEIVTLTSDNNSQQVRLEKLHNLISQKNEIAQQIIDLKRDGKMTEEQFAMLYKGKEIMDSIRAGIAGVEKEENELLTQRKAATEKNLSRFNIAFGTLLLFSLILIVLIFLAINSSLKARLKAERKAITDAAEIHDLYNHAPCGYHSLDENGRFININETLLNWLGYQRDEIIGKMTFTDILSSSSIKVFYDNFSRFKETGVVRDLEFEAVRKDGSVFPIIVNSSSSTDGSGKYIKSRSSVFDNTEIKRAQNRIKELAAAVHKANEAALEEKKLRIEQFSFITSHELRHEFSKILSFINLTKMNEQSPEEIQTSIREIEKASASVNTIIEKLNLKLNPSAADKPSGTTGSHRLSEMEEICLVDDDPVINLINGKILRKILPDVPLKIFESVESGLNHIRENPQTKRFIFLDLNFPVKSGWDFLDQFHSMETSAPVVILSSSIDPEDHQRARTFKEVLAFYSKPLTLAIIETLNDLTGPYD